jgi:hypothetical protein
MMSIPGSVLAKAHASIAGTRLLLVLNSVVLPVDYNTSSWPLSGLNVDACIAAASHDLCHPVV